MTNESNRAIADKLRQAADLLEQQQASPHRVHAYRRAADSVAAVDADLREIVAREGAQALQAIPGVGPRIGAAIAELLRTGRWSQLERLRGTLDPEHLFRTIPGLGAALAKRLHETLHVDSLEALEVAAHDGRLAAVPGFGFRRAAMVRAALAAMLGRARGQRGREPADEPAVEALLDVDRQYRAESDRLPKIAPRRFNPGGDAWLPILHTERDGWHFTALYSNTALAHRLGRTRDWVVLYFEADHRTEGQRTVVTETQGSLRDRRVVRGRELECERHYARATRADARRPGPPSAAAGPVVGAPAIVREGPALYPGVLQRSEGTDTAPEPDGLSVRRAPTCSQS